VIRLTPLRSRALLLAGSALLLAANLAWLVSFEVLYVRRQESRAQEIVRNDERLTQLQAELRKKKDELERLRTVGKDRELFYGEILDRAENRFTPRLRRLRRLAADSGLRISSFNFTETEDLDFPVRIIEARFSTDGNYASLKKLLNLLEIDKEFLTVTKIGLQRNDPATGRGEVTLALSVRTAFYDPQMAQRPKRGKGGASIPVASSGGQK